MSNGWRLTYDPTRPRFSRVLELARLTATGPGTGTGTGAGTDTDTDTHTYEPVDPERLYTVVAPENLACGGDHCVAYLRASRLSSLPLPPASASAPLPHETGAGPEEPEPEPEPEAQALRERVIGDIVVGYLRGARDWDRDSGSGGDGDIGCALPADDRPVPAAGGPVAGVPCGFRVVAAPRVQPIRSVA